MHIEYAQNRKKYISVVSHHDFQPHLPPQRKYCELGMRERVAIKFKKLTSPADYYFFFQNYRKYPLDSIIPKLF